jgi:hypothetical protein
LRFCMKQVFEGLKCLEKESKLRRVLGQSEKGSLSLEGKGSRLLIP